MKALLAVPSLYKNSKPLSLLSSDAFAPKVIIGSVMVVTVLFTVVVVPLIVKLPVTLKFPPTNAFSAIPAPPETINAPELVPVEPVLSDTVTAPLNVGVPLNVPLNAAPLIVGVVRVLFVNV